MTRFITAIFILCITIFYIGCNSSDDNPTIDITGVWSYTDANDGSGTLAMALSNNNISGVATGDNFIGATASVGSINGTIAINVINLSIVMPGVTNPIIVNGIVSGNQISGNWTDSSGTKTWSAVRTQGG